LHVSGQAIHNLFRVHVVEGVDALTMMDLLDGLLDLLAEHLPPIDGGLRTRLPPFALDPYLPIGARTFWLRQLVISWLTGEESRRADARHSGERHWGHGALHRGRNGGCHLNGCSTSAEQSDRREHDELVLLSVKADESS
jgi:hypothetical protein